MRSPYATRPDYAFWRRAMSGRAPGEVDPVTSVPFVIGRDEKVATAGSCFAQHMSRTLIEAGFDYLVTEGSPGDADYGLFPARFGNIYTARQLLQLQQRAYGLFEPTDLAWRRADDRFVDPFRPRISADGFATVDDMLADRLEHFAAVRRMFEDCAVFVFTLGLTEAWTSAVDGAVFPLPPGVIGEDFDPGNYTFHNFTVAEVEADLLSFIDLLRIANPGVRVILTVSPVALVATYEDRHVLVSTTYSKSVLRVSAELVARERPQVAYFPSYEIITGPHAGGTLFAEDLREVRPQAVGHVMGIFARHFLDPEKTASTPNNLRNTKTASAAELQRIAETDSVICDERVLDPSE